jgi:hypothetical protein
MNSIASTIATSGRSRNAHRPFGAASTSTTEFDPAELVINNDPLPTKRALPNKYAARFAELEMGQAMAVPPNHVAKVSAALRNWITAKGMKGKAHVRSVTEYPECKKGWGRVWLKEGPQSAPHVAKAGKGRTAANDQQQAAA